MSVCLFVLKECPSFIHFWQQHFPLVSDNFTDKISFAGGN